MPSSYAAPSPRAPRRLLDAVRDRLCHLHCSLRTEEACVHWVRAKLRFRAMRHPHDMAGPEVEAFLPSLSSECGVSVSTHRQALSARLPLVLSQAGVAAVPA